jgi:RimJ/RimL family protein N-acetyltransferase
MDDDVVIVTQRLVLRRWRADDAGPMAAINRDPEVSRYLNRAVDAAAVDSFLERVQGHWTEHGFGFFAMESREPDAEGELLGFVGVGYPTFLPAVAHRPELGWRLRRSAWGRGLATEGAIAARRHAEDELGFDELISIIHPENTRSQSVARKLGMEVEGQVHNPVLGIPVDIWRSPPPG